MNPADLTPGTPVRITTDRTIAGRNWQDTTGTVYGEYRRDDIPDWCLVKITDRATIIVGFAPDEVESA